MDGTNISTLFVRFLEVGAALVLLLYISRVGQRPKGYPPGPPTLPLIGNLHQIPKTRRHVQFQKWADEYGPIYSLILGTQVMIVLSSDEIAKDLLNKRGAIYSSRPDFYIAQTIVSGGLRGSLMPYGDTWRLVRRCWHSLLNLESATTLVPYQNLENKQMLVEILDNPDEFTDHIQRYTDSVTTQLIFGFRSATKEEPQVKEMFENLHFFSSLTNSPGAGLLDAFPVLRQLPSLVVPTKRLAEAFRLRDNAFYGGLWKQTKQQVLDKTAKPSFTVQLIKAQETEGFSDDFAAYAAGVLHEGGSETSAATLTAFIQAMILYPEVQLKANEELSRVCGDRLPTIDDQADLPYVRACVKEALRWFPVLTLGVPHSVTRQDTYMGYTIPKNASVALNIWGINRDEKRYANARDFEPARFLGDLTTAAESAALPDATKRDHFTFGAGRRLCPGMHISERTLFLSIARLMWGFAISKGVRKIIVEDADGKTKESLIEVTPDQDNVTDGFATALAAFPAKFTPRSDRRVEVMRSAWAECQGLLDARGQWKEVPEGLKLPGYQPNAEMVD